MAPETDLTGWSSLLLGLFALAACIAEFRRAGTWKTMLEQMVASPAIILNVGLLELVLGAIVYLTNPWAPQDWLASLMKILGGLMMLEALVTLAVGDLYLDFWLKHVGEALRAWAVVILLVGVALMIAGIHRLT